MESESEWSVVYVVIKVNKSSADSCLYDDKFLLDENLQDDDIY